MVNVVSPQPARAPGMPQSGEAGRRQEAGHEPEPALQT